MADGLRLGMPITFLARDMLTRAAETTASLRSPLPHITMKRHPEQMRTAFVSHRGEPEAMTGSHRWAMAAKSPMLTPVPPQEESLVTRGDNRCSSLTCYSPLSHPIPEAWEEDVLAAVFEKQFWSPTLLKIFGERCPIFLFSCWREATAYKGLKPSLISAWSLRKPQPTAERWPLFTLPADLLFLSSRGRAAMLTGQPEQPEAGTHRFLCGDQEDKRQTSEPQLASLAGPSDKGFLRSTS